MAAEIVIVDDDPTVGSLTEDLLSGAGYSTHLVRDSRLALAAVREHSPRLVLLDILMPGVDGLSILHEIKSDPGLSATKVAILSGKTFAAEIDRARDLGADLFIEKPYDIKEFPERVGQLIGPPAGGPREERPKAVIRLRVWGGSEEGSTPCLSLEAMGRLFILDAGRGAERLGRTVLGEGRHKEAWLLLSHFHEDHVSGLGACPLLREPGFQLRILGPKEPGSGLSAQLRAVLEKSFAADPRPLEAKLALNELQEDTYELAPGARLTAFYANHPSTTLGFVLDLAGRRVVYCPDSELYGESATALQDYDERLTRICMRPELLIHDARYNDADHLQRANQGHSSASGAAALAADCEAARLMLFHADPSYSEEQLQALEGEARQALEAKGARIPCMLAKDGLELEF